MDINKTIQKAMSKGHYISAKKNGKLSNYHPNPGEIIIMDDGDFGTVLKTPNSVKDFTVRVSNGLIIRKNVVNGDIKGYLNSLYQEELGLT